MKKIVTTLILALLLISFVGAFGVAPSHKNINFEPREEYTLNFRIINDEHKDMKVGVYAKGELAEYVEIENGIIDISFDEFEKTVEYKLSLPQKLPPGENKLSIFAVQLDDETEDEDFTVIKTNLGVIHNLIVNVPYPGHYLQGMVFVSEAKPDEKVTFTISVSNLGNVPIKKAIGTIIITDSEDNRVAQIKTKSISLRSGEKSKLVGEWIANVDPGTYHVQAVVEYDSKLLVLEKDFDVGEPLVDIKDIQIAQFKLGSVAKFDIVLESKWNNEIKEVKTTTEIHDQNSNLMSSYESSEADIPAMGTKIVKSYWDTEGVNPGEYFLSVRLRYFGRVREKNYEISVSQNNIEFLGSPFTGRVIEESDTGEEVSIVPFLIALGIVLLVVTAILLIKKGKKPVQAPVIEKKIIESIKPKGLREYIKFNMSQGISIKAIKKRALAKGFDEQEIDEIILEIEDQN